jgi:subtilase family serine protease
MEAFELKLFKWAGQRRAGAVLAAGAAGSLLLLGLAAPASGATHPQSRLKVAVPQGIGTAALKDASVFGPTPPSTPETVSFVLKARNLGLLEALVEAGMPGGYDSVGRFARDYGQPRSNISALESYLSQYGISTSAYADGLDVTATGTAGEFDHALSVQQDQYRVPAVAARHGMAGRPAMTIHGTTDSALLPRNLARFVLSILGLTSYPTFASDAVHTPKLSSGVKPSAVQTGSLTPEDFASQYNLNPLYKEGATGAGETIGIVTLASVLPSDPEYFWSNVLGISTKPNRITLDNVDGGSGPVSDALGSDETTLDVEQSGALAPYANIVVYQAPNTDFGFVDGFFAAASQNVADSVSSSWGESETEIQASVNSGVESSTYAISFDEAYLELAAQGQSAFVSAGDFGAYTAAEDLGTTNLSAGNPDSSPWITAAGGTTLPGTIPLTATDSATIATQRTWAWDWLWPHFADFGAPTEAAFAESEPIGGGGGFSVFEPTPFYQQLVPSAHQFSATEYLTPIDPETVAPGLTEPTEWSFNPAPSVTTGYGTGRATPDVSTDADPFTGYEEYFTGFSGAPLEDGWGGTSFVAPQLNGSTALIDSLLGHRVGFWNPSIYQFATQHNSPFTPLDSASANNDNLYYTGTRGHIYNVGSGLGTPNLAKLAGDFARR